MRCYLHIGTEKTGSSYLQCKLALARDQLLQQGIWFAKGASFDEQCMRTGRISGGNALKVAESMERDDWQAIGKDILRWHAEAKARAVDSVLISSELLLRPLSFASNVSRLLSELLGAGFQQVELLLILRNPADQCLSLYKHRAKGGSAGDIQKWCESGYRLPEHLAGLRRQLQKSEVGLTVRQYDRADGALDQIFFKDWLRVSVPSVQMPSTVNPSLTLPELDLIRRVASSRTELVAPLYDRLLAVPPADKFKSKALEQYARSVAARAVWRYREEWQVWNRSLPKGETLAFPGAEPDVPSCPAELSFSEQQLAALASFMGEEATLRFSLRLWWRSRLRPGLGRLARKVRLKK